MLGRSSPRSKCKSSSSNRTTIGTTTTAATDMVSSPLSSSSFHTTPRQQQRRHVLFSVGQLVAAVAVAASLSSLITAMIAARFLISYQHQQETDFQSHLVSANEAPVESREGIIKYQYHLRPLPSSLSFSPGNGNVEPTTHILERIADNELLQRNYEPFQQSASRKKNEVFKNDYDDDVFPKIAWLMSFPNSGTSFTLHMIRELTNATTATNYALEGEIKDKPSIPIHPKMADGGPWLELLPNRSTTVPSRYILTKTHCGGFCNHCPYQRFLETPRSFQTACRTGTKAFFPKTLFPRAETQTTSNTTTVISGSNLVPFAENSSSAVSSGSTGVLRTLHSPPRRRRVTYNISQVQKAIHLIRNPFDNIVARFHLDYYRQIKTNATFATIFPNNSTGFQNWCFYYDRIRNNNKKTNFQPTTTTTTMIKRGTNSNISIHKLSLPSGSWDQDETNRWIDLELRKAMMGVPCRGEFYRYIQWHNNAFDILGQYMDVPTLNIYYEDYQDQLSSVQQSLLQFLELNQVVDTTDNNGSIEFQVGKEYGAFYSNAQKMAIWRFLKEFSSHATWKSLQRYYE